MKRLILLFLSCLLLALDLAAGDIYQKGTINLIPDEAFARGIDWSKLFIANFPGSPKPFERTHEYLALAPDNSIYVVEYNSNTAGTVYKFAANGTLESTKAPEPGKSNPNMWARHLELPVVNDRNELWISENARLDRCDTQGNVLSVTSLKNSIEDLLFLKGGNLVLMGNNSVRLWNPPTAEETVITRYNPQKPFAISLPLLPLEPAKQEALKKVPGMVGGGVGFIAPGNMGKMKIAGTSDGKLVVGHSEWPEIRIFSADGHKINSFTLPFQRPTLSPEQKAEAVQRIVQSLDSLAANKRVAPDAIEKAKEQLKDYPSEVTYFSNLLADDQGNILVFLTDPSDSGNVEFIAFSQSGKVLGKCRLALPQDVSLRLDRRKQMVIRNGWLYALIQKSISGKKQVQLARFKLEYAY
jgi:hypothetical protein